jgi:hypothetical protein
VKRFLPRISLFALALALWFGAAGGEDLPLPIEKRLSVGESTIAYGGQTLRFTTSVPLIVQLDAPSATIIHFRVKVQPGTPLPSGPAGSADNTVKIYWVNFSTDVYEGGAPSGTIEGDLNTEGGFVDR